MKPPCLFIPVKVKNYPNLVNLYQIPLIPAIVNLITHRRDDHLPIQPKNASFTVKAFHFSAAVRIEDLRPVRFKIHVMNVIGNHTLPDFFADGLAIRAEHTHTGEMPVLILLVFQ